MILRREQTVPDESIVAVRFTAGEVHYPFANAAIPGSRLVFGWLWNSLICSICHDIDERYSGVWLYAISNKKNC